MPWGGPPAPRAAVTAALWVVNLGEAQAAAAAARLAPFGPMPLHCSDLPRAVATAGYIARAWGSGDAGLAAPAAAPLLPDARLREIDLGVVNVGWASPSNHPPVTVTVLVQ